MKNYDPNTPNLDQVKEVLIEAADIERRLKILARDIQADYGDKNPVLITLLKGSLYFAADLTRHLDIRHTIDFMSMGHSQAGLAEVRQAPTTNLEGRHILLLEDIIDTGLTMNFILTYLKEKGAASVQIATLLDNPARRLIKLPIRYIGFPIPDVYVVGYGLDVHEDFRNLPHIYRYSQNA